MFKKLKDKLAEEVKSSPQRFQQFAQAAQAAVTSASSSISDITKDDLFSIVDSDSQNSSSVKSQEVPVTQQNTFQDVSLQQPISLNTSIDSVETGFVQDGLDKERFPERQRRLSNSSFASDVSFRLPNYESPSMYHLQSDMEISASEAEERSFTSGSISLDRVTKEQLYAAYKRTQERYSKYRTQYADLARHYKLIERENTKARSVLVETQDKALRRISELKEQCALEQSAKAHLEKALRVEIEERNMKIQSLNTKIQLLPSDTESKTDNSSKKKQEVEEPCLIYLNDDDCDKKQNANIEVPSEVSALNDKLEKMDQLLNKYKESLKSSKEKNTQMMTELQIVSTELESKKKDNDELKKIIDNFEKVKDEMKKLNDANEELQNKLNTYDFAKAKELSTLEADLNKAQEEIAQLRKKIDVFSKREEENAISLAENKLRIHKELESKESEIKSLKESLVNTTNELQSLNIVINDYKNTINLAEEKNNQLKKELSENNLLKSKVSDLEAKLQDLSQKYQNAELHRAKSEEECKCLHLQIQQENAEKLALKDRNDYLEKRNTQLSDENSKKSSEINSIEKELLHFKNETSNSEACQTQHINEQKRLEQEVSIWRSNCDKLEKEIQEEREELVKLQLEIEKLMTNHDSTQTKNSELLLTLAEYEAENLKLKKDVSTLSSVKSALPNVLQQINNLRKHLSPVSNEINLFKSVINEMLSTVNENVNLLYKAKLDNHDSNELRISYNNLKTKCDASETEVQKLTELNKEISNACEDLEKESNKLRASILEKKLVIETCNAKFHELSEKYQLHLEKCKTLEEEKCCLDGKLLDMEAKYTVKQEENNNLLLENEKLNTNITEISSQLQITVDKCAYLEKERRDLSDKISDIDKKNDILQDEYNKQICKMADKQSDNETIRAELSKVCEDLKTSVEKCKNLEKEKSALMEEMNDIETKYTILQDILSQLRKEHQIALDSFKETETNNQGVNDVLQELKVQNSDLTLELQNYAVQVKTYTDQITILESDKQLLQGQLSESQDKKQYFTTLEVDLKLVTEENKSLKDQLKQIAETVQTLESELDVIKRPHLEIESEKDRLSDIIKELENKEQEIKIINNESIHIPNIENNTADFSNSISKTDYETINEENKRLQSEIEGLKTYLTKISKENSILNDKLRESIDFTENTKDNTSELVDPQNCLEKEKLNDLLRENSLLVEENLELKDQLNIQNANTMTETNAIKTDSQITNLKEKYNDLSISKNKLEHKLADMEQVNSTVNLNMQQLQVNNEKLRLSNEKLERRLDEALVSLHHLHSMQENTELEYLRNILYEYLTGSGTHSVTLAKVLAAVVKFDEAQTKIVLQKERERQGLLRQLGLKP